MRLIETANDLDSATSALARYSTFYIDTEFDSARDAKTLSLLQISGGEEVFIIDAVRIGDLRPLAQGICQPDAVWVLHAGLQDIELLTRDLSLEKLPNLFDTQVAWAMVGPEHGVSLAYLTYKTLGLRASKMYQQEDWLRRPLPRAQLEYAAHDIENLPAIEKSLRAKTDALGRTPAVLEASKELLQPEPTRPNLLNLSSFRNAWQLEPESQAALHALIDWHNEQVARDPRFDFNSKTLLNVANRCPRTLAELRRIKGVPPSIADRYGTVLVGILAKALASSKNEYVPLEPPPYATFEDIRLEAWLEYAKAELSAALNVAPELAFPGRLVRRMASAIRGGQHDYVRGADELTGWRREMFESAYRQLAGRSQQ